MKYFVCLLPVLLCACVSRTQEFHCILEANPADTFEMAITPTSVTYRSRPYRFKEESGALRRYVADDGASEIEFNAASGKLIVRSRNGEIAWSCKRYEGLK